VLTLIKVAITGGLSSGKSSVCRIFKELGAYVMSADAIVHQLLLANEILGNEIVELLGEDVLVDGKIDRSVVARKVFHDSQLLQKLEALLHPAVREAVEQEYQAQRKSPAPPPLFVVEIPLLFETGGERFYDTTVAVIADEELCRRRYAQRTGQGANEFDRRNSRQLSQQEKAAKADHVIVNNGDINQLEENARQLYQKLLNQPK
jgi:dephospho-CoA kinase